MNILFTTSAAPRKSPFFTNEKRPPLGLGSLISLLRNEGHKVLFIDNYLHPSNFIEAGFLQKNKIDHVAIHANTICYRDTLRMFSEIERLRTKGLWQGKIIVGGPHTSVALETIPGFVDCVVQGEGERAILKIIDSKVNGRVIREERIKDLDTLPFQPWDIFSALPYDYTCPWFDSKAIFTMNTSRGCPYNCSFCSVGSIWGKQYTYFSADRIISEIEYLLKDYGAHGIYFREDNFTLNLERTVEFCERMLQKNIRIHWACETRVDNLTKELIELMSASGCKAFYLGIESGSQRILDNINKQITVEQITDAVTWCKKYDIKTYCSLITGLPDETYEDYLITKKLMERLKPYSYAFNVFVGIPKSSLYEYVVDNNLYEYIDDIGLVYPPGYSIKAKFFYGKESKGLVDFEFKQLTTYDKQLLKELSRVDRGKKISSKLPNVLLGIVRKTKKVFKSIFNQLL